MLTGGYLYGFGAGFCIFFNPPVVLIQLWRWFSIWMHSELEKSWSACSYYYTLQILWFSKG